MKLVRGAGSPTTGACWMSAISHYAGYAWSDHPKCVDPLIRRLCITINDCLASDDDRERVIGPHLMTPIGTQQGPDLTVCRAFRVVDKVVRDWIPRSLDQLGFAMEAAVLRSLSPIVDEASALDARDALDARAALAARAARAARDARAARAAFDALDALDARAARAAFDAFDAFDALDALDALAAHSAENELLPLVLELCAMGERCEIPQVRSLAELPQ